MPVRNNACFKLKKNARPSVQLGRAVGGILGIALGTVKIVGLAGIVPVLVGAVIARQKHEDENNEPADKGDEAQKDHPSRAPCVMETPRHYGVARNDDAEGVDDQNDQAGVVEKSWLAACCTQHKDGENGQINDHIEQGKSPVFCSGSASAEIGIALERKKSLFHFSPPFVRRT